MKSLLIKDTKEDNFAMRVLEGLSAPNKRLPSKFLYDSKGSKLFEEIMNLPEYYPTKCEFEIFEKYKSQILEFCSLGEPLEIIDLGAGNGLKAMVLLKFFMRRISVKYTPVDFSESSVRSLEGILKEKFPTLEVEGIFSDYSHALKIIHENKQMKKMVLMLGSNIGNFSVKEAVKFLREIREALSKDDLLMIGFDLKKDPNVIRSAYDDSRGITAEFNLNVLKRINTELGSRFDISNFMFYPTYDPRTGKVKSHLLSKIKQDVYIEKLEQSFTFDKWEAIRTECSNKFDLPAIEKIAALTGFSIEANFYDSKEYFVDSLWKVV